MKGTGTGIGTKPNYKYDTNKRSNSQYCKYLPK